MTATPWGLRSGVESQKGAAADVALAITCDAARPADVRVEMNQCVGKKIANGSSFIGFLCTGKPQTETVTVLASGAPGHLTRSRSSQLPNHCANGDDHFDLQKSGQSAG